MVHLMVSPPSVSTILPVPQLAPSPPVTEPSSLPLPSSDNVISCVTLLSTMPYVSIVKLLHHEKSTLPSICPCDTSNNSDTNTHWTAKELHHIMGCWKFQNYKHILRVSCDGKWVDGGEFPPSLSSFDTIPKANCSGPLDHTRYKYLDAALTLFLATASLSAVFGMLWSSLTKLHSTIGLLGWRHLPWIQPLLLFASSGPLLDLLRVASTAIATLNFSVWLSVNISLTLTPKLSLLLQNANCPTVLSLSLEDDGPYGSRISYWEADAPDFLVLCKSLMLRVWWRLFQANIRVTWLLPSFSSTALDTMSKLGFLYSLSASFTICAMAIKSAPSIKHTQCTALPLDVLPLHMLFTCIILGTSNTTSWIVIILILTASQPQSTLTSNMTAVSSVLWFATIIPPWKRNTGARVERMDPATNMLLVGTVMDIPILMTESDSGGPVHNSSYSILFDNGMSTSIPLSDMANLIPLPPVVSTPHPSSTSLDSLLPPFLCLNSRITYKHNGQYHKGFPGQ
jgi:hypothetical protein